MGDKALTVIISITRRANDHLTHTEIKNGETEIQLGIVSMTLNITGETGWPLTVIISVIRRANDHLTQHHIHSGKTSVLSFFQTFLSP